MCVYKIRFYVVETRSHGFVFLFAHVLSRIVGDERVRKFLESVFATIYVYVQVFVFVFVHKPTYVGRIGKTMCEGGV